MMQGGFRVLAEAADATGAVEAVLRERPDACLLDVRMPGGGIEAAVRLAELAPDTAVVMLTVSASAEDLLAALRAGARGYLPKDMSPDRLPAALRGVLRGEAALPRTFVGRMLQELRALPDRELAPAARRRRRAHRPRVGDPADAARAGSPRWRSASASRSRRSRCAATSPPASPSSAPTAGTTRCGRSASPREDPTLREGCAAIAIAATPAPPARHTRPPARGCARPASRRCWSRTASPCAG